MKKKYEKPEIYSEDFVPEIVRAGDCPCPESETLQPDVASLFKHPDCHCGDCGPDPDFS